MQSKFLLGALKITPDARRALGRLPYDLIARHAICEHGLISPAERRNNISALQSLGRIVSRYRADPTDKHTDFIVIVTEATWRETTVSLERAKAQAEDAS